MRRMYAIYWIILGYVALSVIAWVVQAIYYFFILKVWKDFRVVRKHGVQKTVKVGTSPTKI